METLNKNKEEIEKILKEIEISKKECAKRYGDLERWETYHSHDTMKLIGAYQERIKTSILWCEDEIKFIEEIYDRFKHSDGADYQWRINIIRPKLEQLQTHLSWLKEQEKKQ